MNGVYEINRRPGVLWAVLQFPLSRLVIATLALAIVANAGQAAENALGVARHSPVRMLFAILLAALIILVYHLYVRLLERRPVMEYALSGSARAFGRGFAIGTALFTSTMVILWFSGVVNILMDNGWPALYYQFIISGIFTAVLEETLLRGVLFRIVEESLGSWVALAISAAVFGALHAFNPGATVTSGIAIALEAGVLLAAAYMYTRSLWLPIGLHAAWNFTEGGIFGASVSGTGAYGFLRSSFTGPDWVTGGKFGPEASVVAVAVCLVAGVIFVVLASKRDLLAPSVWARRKAGA